MVYDYYFKNKNFKTGLRYRVRRRLYAKLLQKNKYQSLLEIGPGLGNMAAFCRERNINYTAVERNRTNGNALKKQGYMVYIAKVPPLPLFKGTDKFDIIFAEHMIEHLADVRECERFIRACKKHLVPGGRVILLYPDYNIIGKLFYHDYTHSFITTKKRVEDLLTDMDLKLEYSQRYWLSFTGWATWLAELTRPLWPVLPLNIKLNFMRHNAIIAIKY